MIARIGKSPVQARVVPFAIFMLLTAAQDWFGEPGRYWVYFIKTVLIGVMLFALRPYLDEMRWKLSWEAVAVGIGVFVMWVGIDGWYPGQSALLKAVGLGGSGTPKALVPWNPHHQFGDGSFLAWFFIVMRTLGSSIVVPPLEEVFFRSFLYRFLAKPDFMSLPLGKFCLTPFLLGATIFGFEHQQWLAGILCGIAYQGLVLWKGRLGDAIMAHAITNFVLAIYVVGWGAWQFWS